jgi:hypothetical protein
MLQCLEKQSPSPPQALIGGHMGAHTGAAQLPVTQRWDPQSALAPQGVPSAQGCGPVAHAGGRHDAF